MKTEDSSGINSSNGPPLLTRASLELQHEALVFIVLVIFVEKKTKYVASYLAMSGSSPIFRTQLATFLEAR